MYIAYANLIYYQTEPQFGTMSEARLTESVQAWVGEAYEMLTSEYRFYVTYFYNDFGFAVDATIQVKYFVNEEWTTLGTFSLSSGTKLSTVISTPVCQPICTPSNIVSQPIHYYVSNYYAPGYYV